MATEMVFSGGHRVIVIGTNAAGLIQALDRSGSDGWVPVSTEVEGEILVNPNQVAYLREIGDQESVLDLPG